MINVPIVFDPAALDALTANFGQTSPDGIYYGPVQNVSTVLIADDSGANLDGYQATDTDSQAIYGKQAAGALVTILAAPADAAALSLYLQRSFPSYWFSGIEVQFNRLTEAQRDAVATLDIGSQIRVSKLFPNMASATVEDLFVEGLEHRITPASHVVTIYTSPTLFAAAFILDTSALDDIAYVLG